MWSVHEECGLGVQHARVGAQRVTLADERQTLNARRVRLAQPSGAASQLDLVRL
jgi:hypothetical protein